jgi:monoamine oxidase
MHTQVLIAGGGLAGMALAHLCHQRGLDYQLVEARQRLGGRILTRNVTANGHTAGFDLGPAWFWPGQPRMAALLQSLDLQAFEQYASGDVSLEDETGRVFRGRGSASMEGSYRIAGGIGSLVSALERRLDAGRIMRGQQVVKVHYTDSTVDGVMTTTIHDANGNTQMAPSQTITSQMVVLALPPRVVAQHIAFAPALPAAATGALQATPTWMAGHAKVVAVYETPFWREAGLSGDAMSRRGPLTEIHDASPASGGPYALFGFVGVPASARAGQAQALTDLALAQLGRLFGQAALRPLDITLQDWATEPETATALDLHPMYEHPAYGLPRSLQGLMGGRLILGSTESASQFGGYMEGALEAAEVAFDTIQRHVLQTN